ncbi:MAG: SDR family oxidoreductase [Pseudomonadota bacterium]
MIAITGASGNLGRLVLSHLLRLVPPDQIVATVRDVAKADDLRALGVQVRQADYDRPVTLAQAFEGADKLLLISAVVPGQRFGQHKAVIDAAKRAGVKLLAYTSMLRADSSRLSLAAEHERTEEYLRRSGLDFVLLRNGWYLENDTGALEGAIAHGTIIGSSADGRLASASRADYAEAAARVLTQQGHENKTYELAGDVSFSMAEFAAEVSRQASVPVAYQNLPGGKYAEVLLGFGLPQMIVDVVVDASQKASLGELDSTSRDLSGLIGRPTTPYSEAIRLALQGRRGADMK